MCNVGATFPHYPGNLRRQASRWNNSIWEIISRRMFLSRPTGEQGNKGAREQWPGNLAVRTATFIKLLFHRNTKPAAKNNIKWITFFTLPLVALKFVILLLACSGRENLALSFVLLQVYRVLSPFYDHFSLYVFSVLFFSSPSLVNKQRNIWFIKKTSQIRV